MPTGIFALNDDVALGVIASLLDHGIPVPQQVSVVGYDDIPSAKRNQVPLTTIAQPQRRMGELAARALLDRLKTPDAGPRHYELLPRLVQRSSTLPAPGTGGGGSTAASTPGTAPAPRRPPVGNRLILGFDIGGTKCAVSLADTEATVIAKKSFPTKQYSGPHDVLAALSRLAGELLSTHGADGTLLAAGISCGGPLDSRAGLVLSPPNLPGWDRVPVVSILEEALGVPAFSP